MSAAKASRECFWSAHCAARHDGPPMLEKFQANFSIASLAIKSSGDGEEVKRVITATFRYLGIPTQNTF